MKYFRWARWPGRGLWWKGSVLLALAWAALFSMSCRTANRSVELPVVPGATYLGSEGCEQCHGEIYKSFRTADHYRLVALGPNAVDAGCESCHGPSAQHAESGGEVKPYNSFAVTRSPVVSARLSTPPPRATETVCFECHAEVRGHFNLASHHLVPEGEMTCSQCHPPHKGSAHLGGSTALLSQNETCLNCHPAQRGPHVFEHEAMREGCTICHHPHGSVNAKLLIERNANLCLKCHFQRVQGGNVLIGGSIHGGAVDRLSQGTCWTAGCHEAVHGSRVNSSLRF